MDANNLETTGKLMFVSRDPLCAEVSLADVCEATESSGNHFIRNHYRVPNIKRDEWALSVTGLVLNSLEIHYDDLIAMPSTEVVGLMECAGNSRSIVHPRVPGVQWGHGAIGTACWKGVPVHKVLEKAMLLQSASEVVFIGNDGDQIPISQSVSRYAISVPLDKLLEPTTILAYSMDGKGIPKHHGYPVRLIVPGWYGMTSVKWITEMKVIDSPNSGVYEREYSLYPSFNGNFGNVAQRVTALKVKSLIANPGSGSVIDRTMQQINGLSWCGEGYIRKVEVSFDDTRTWNQAEVEEPYSPYSAQRWKFDWEPPVVGHYLIRSRATDSHGNVQPLVANWNYRGLQVNSVHCVPIRVVDN